MRSDVSQRNVERAISLPDAEISRRYLAGETIAELAEVFGVSNPTIAKALDRMRTPRRPAKQRTGKFAGDKNPAWKGGRSYAECRQEKLDAANKRYEDNRHSILERRKQIRTPEQRKRDTAAMKRRHAALRAEMITAYGGKCKCCGESQPLFLELDHTENDGHAHRRVVGRGSGVIYRALKKAGWPKRGFQLLCANCNAGKARNGGKCPHGR